MARVSRPLTLVVLAMALSACDAVPNLAGPGQILQGKVTGGDTSKIKIAVTDSVPPDFTNATVIRLNNGKFSYTLPDNKLSLIVAAFKDENDNDRWDEGEPITTDAIGCDGCSYLILTRTESTWTVTEQPSSEPRSATLTDATIRFNA